MIPSCITPISSFLYNSEINVASLEEMLLSYLLQIDSEIEIIDVMDDPISYIDAKDHYNVILAFAKLIVDESLLKKHKLL